MRRRLIATGALHGLMLVTFLSASCTEKRGQRPTEDQGDAQASQEQQTSPAATEPEAKGPPPKAEAPPKVPFEGGEHRPALSRMAEGEDFDAEVFSDYQQCKECHAEIVTEWEQSMHSFASLSNPIYRMSFEGFLEDRGEENTKFCAGCHDPALMFDPTQKLAVEAAPAASHLGVSCGSCHGAVEAGTAGNGDYALTTSPIPIPKEGDAESLKAHLARVGNATSKSDALCISCHRGALTPEMGHEVVLLGLDEWGPWRGSVYTGNQTSRIDDEDIAARSCTSCHMPEADGHASHRFPGGHTAFAAMIDSSDQLEAQRALLEGSATLDVFELEKLPASTQRDGQQVVGFDVVVFNERVGHTFPGGAKDLRDTWLEVVLEDANGERLAASGVEHERTGREDYAYVFHVRLASEDGKTQREHSVSHFRTPVYDHTIAPRDAAVVRYVFALPEGFDEARLPLKVETRIRHRRLSKEIHRAVCEMSKGEASQAFDRKVAAYKNLELDACAEQPIIDIAAHAAWIGQGAEARPALSPQRPEWERYYLYGLGLLHHVQENIGEARAAFQQAQSHLDEENNTRHRAMIIQGLAKVSARQGRTDEAVELFEEAGELVGDHPSIWYGIGEAYMRVWRFEEAAQAFGEAAKLQRDDRILRRRAIALGSAGEPAEALAVAHEGLSIEGRDPHLLRSQMLAYRNLDSPEEWERQASEAYNVYKRDTRAPHVRDLCSREDAVCRAERTPIGVRWLKPE